MWLLSLAMINVVDPVAYRGLQELRTVSEQQLEHVAAFGVHDPLLMEGREVMLNRDSPEHYDEQDPKDLYVLLVPLGVFQGGVLVIPELHIRLRYLHRSMVMPRGKALAHYVEPWTGGQRKQKD